MIIKLGDLSTSYFLFFEAYLSTTYVPATLANPLLWHAVGQWQLPVGIFPSHKVAENESMSMPFPSCSDILVQNQVTFSHIHKGSISCEDFRYLISGRCMEGGHFSLLSSVLKILSLNPHLGLDNYSG